MFLFQFNTPVPLSVELFALNQKSQEKREKAIESIYPHIQTAIVDKLKSIAFSHPENLSSRVQILDLFIEKKENNHIECNVVIGIPKKSPLGDLLTTKLEGIFPSELTKIEIDLVGEKLIKYLISEGLESTYDCGTINVSWKPATLTKEKEITNLISSSVIADQPVDVEIAMIM